MTYKNKNNKNIICQQCGKVELRRGPNQSFCKECSKARDNKVKHNWTNENKEYYSEYRNRYKKENKDIIKLKNHEYYLKNKSQITIRNINWMNNHKDIILNNKRRWRKNNPEKVKLEKLKRRARHNNIIEIFTIKEWFKKIDNTNGICPSCNNFVGKNKLTLDHIFPISKAKKGRIYSINDVQPLCVSCNSKKKNKVIIK